jgi:flagellar motility protein MotE (MotC chaperone)
MPEPARGDDHRLCGLKLRAVERELREAERQRAEIAKRADAALEATHARAQAAERERDELREALEAAEEGLRAITQEWKATRSKDATQDSLNRCMGHADQALARIAARRALHKEEG